MIQNLISRTRRNHGLEHATLNLLHERHPYRSFAGHSDPQGFWILGEIEAPELTAVATEALEKLQGGERHLAIHENCGTNMLASGALAGLAGTLGTVGGGDRRGVKWDRIPLIITLATMGIILSRPLGMFLQRNVTTSGDPGSLKITKVITHQQGQITAHRVQTQG